jgi:hypothetical protein
MTKHTIGKKEKKTETKNTEVFTRTSTRMKRRARLYFFGELAMLWGFGVVTFLFEEINRPHRTSRKGSINYDWAKNISLNEK